MSVCRDDRLICYFGGLYGVLAGLMSYICRIPLGPPALSRTVTRGPSICKNYGPLFVAFWQYLVYNGTCWRGCAWQSVIEPKFVSALISVVLSKEC